MAFSYGHLYHSIKKLHVQEMSQFKNNGLIDRPMLDLVKTTKFWIQLF